MADKTKNVFARVAPELKEQAESVLDQLDITMSNAINMFLRQVVLQRGLPFEVRLPEVRRPIALGGLTRDELDTVLNEGYNDYVAGHVKPAGEVFGQMEQEFGL